MRGLLLRILLPLLFLAGATIGASAQGQGFLVVQSPSGGQSLVIDSTVQIRWLSQNNTGTLNISYSIDSGATWTLIDTATAHNGLDSLAWVVPNEPTTKGVVKVETADGQRSGRSTRTFTITDHPIPVIQVLYPNGNEILGVGTTVNIRWSTQYVDDDLDINYSIDSGKTWTLIATVPARSGMDTLAWLVPGDTTTNAFVQVKMVNDTISDRSNRRFTIRADYNPHLTLLYPNGGEIFKVGSTEMIRWESADLPTQGQFSLQYSVDEGATWKQIANRPIRAGLDSMAWTVPNEPTETALVRISQGQGGPGGGGGGLRDTSDAVFTIEGAPADEMLTLISPNGGEQYKVDDPVTISWNAKNVPGQIMIYYSWDNGATWNPIGSVDAHEGADSTTWMVPNTPTQRGRLLIASSDGFMHDTSNATFVILAKPIAGVAETSDALREISLYPNPASNSVEIRWTQGTAASTSVTIYDRSGRTVSAIDAGYIEAGSQRLTVSVESLPAGTYLYELRSGTSRKTGTLTVVR
jgi:hypothetical protein